MLSVNGGIVFYNYCVIHVTRGQKLSAFNTGKLKSYYNNRIIVHLVHFSVTIPSCFEVGDHRAHVATTLNKIKIT